MTAQLNLLDATTSLGAFVTAHDALMPEPSDNPDCVPFYRIWAGLRAVFGADFVNKHNAQFHEAGCHAMHEPTAERRFRVAIDTLRFNAERMTMPEFDTRSSWYRCEPKAPTMNDARALFLSEYKAKWPENRANSKHANEKWREVQTKAMQIVTERYENAMNAYRADQRQHEQREAVKRAEWRAKCDAIREYQNAIRVLTMPEAA